MKAGYRQTEVGEIPEDWDSSVIGNYISEISMGPFGSDIKVSNFKSQGVPVLSGENLRSHRLEDGFKNYVTHEKAKSLKKAVASRGDIVVTHRGTLGQIAFIPNNSEYEKYVISQSQFRVKFDENINPSWAALYFLSRRGSNALLEAKGHTGVPAIAQATTTFRKLFIPLPSRNEQDRIVALLTDADALIVSQERLIEKKRAIKTATMQHLLTGKKRLPGFGVDKGTKQSQLGEIPEDWEITTIGKFTRWLSGGTPRRDRPDFWSGEIPWISASTLKTIEISSSDQMITKEAVAAGSKMAPVNSTLLLVRGSALHNEIRAGLVTAPVAFNQDVKALVPLNGLHPKFLTYYILAKAEDLLKLVSSAGNTAGVLDTNIVKGFHFLKPPEEEQDAIVKVLTDFDLELSHLQSRLLKARDLKTGMMQELLTGRTRLV